MTDQELAKETAFAKAALARNDSWIRFSDSKTGFLFAFSGIILGLLARDISSLISTYPDATCLVRVLILVGTGLTVVSVALWVTAALAAVLPRLRVSDKSSLLYFGSTSNLSEEKLMEELGNLDAESILEQYASQVYATAKIAKRKFGLIQIQMVAAVLVFISWVILLLSQLIA